MGSCASFFGRPEFQAALAAGDLRHFAETGTGRGASVAWALSTGFEQVLSVEIHTPTYEVARTLFADEPRARLFNTTSLEFLKDACQLSGNILFFLDAHFPGSYFDRIDLARAPADITWPLEFEIPLIRYLRQGRSDWILIDDLRVYEHGPYENGPCQPEIMRPRPIEGFCGALLETHELTKWYWDEGYALLRPKATADAAR